MDQLRNEEDSRPLFIATIKPHKPVTGSSIGRWIKIVLDEEGVDPSKFKAHSTQGAAASKAVRSGIPVDIILKTAHWSREAIFTKFHSREVASENISEVVLGTEDDIADN